MPELREDAVLAGRFRLERRIGEGGMGVVWSATNTKTGRRVALKVLRSDDHDARTRRRFMREARAASAVQHANVVEILDVVELDDGVPAIVMELLEGESLGQRIRRERLLPLKVVASIMLPAISAIGTAHAHGIVHRDLKPDNIFLAKGHDGATTVKVLDFGIAKMTALEGEPAQTDALTGTGAMLGTPFYMSPEQLFADESIDYRSDVWALGVILFECLSGMRPTQGENFAHIVKVIATRQIPPLSRVAPDVPVAVADLVMRMLSVEKEDRPQSLREVRDVLRDYTDALATTFGEPVLAPIRQTIDADSSTNVAALRRSDLDLLKTTSDDGKETLEEPAALDKTSSGLGVTLSGARRPIRRYVAGGAGLAIVVALSARALFWHAGAPGAQASGASAISANAEAPAAAPTAPSAPTSRASASAAPVAPVASAADTVAPASSAASSANARRAPRPRASASSASSAAPEASTEAAASTAAPTATRGLVENPPF